MQLILRDKLMLEDGSEVSRVGGRGSGALVGGANESKFKTKKRFSTEPIIF
ncbi:MAG: hypothetical protein AABX44_01985 [Nanoarchaeota archaeon]